MSAPEIRFALPPEMLDQIAQRVADILEERQGSQSEPARRWLTVDQAADYLGCKRQRVYDLRSSGRLSRCGDGRRVLVDRRELDALVEGGA
jgi:excisionase family DNA binding protein